MNTALGLPAPAPGRWRRTRRQAAPAPRQRLPRAAAAAICPPSDRRACPDDVTKMMAALPATAPAKPAKAAQDPGARQRRAATSTSSIPLAAKTIEELGKKTGAWTTTITYDPADINTKNLEQYDALFLSNTTGCFLDAKTTEPPASKEEVEARQAALARLRARRQGPRRHSRHRRLVPQPLRERCRRRRRAWRRRRTRRQPERRGRHAGVGHPALVLGGGREEAPGERPDAHEGRHGGGQRRDVRRSSTPRRPARCRRPTSRRASCRW